MEWLSLSQMLSIMEINIHRDCTVISEAVHSQADVSLLCVLYSLVGSAVYTMNFKVQRITLQIGNISFFVFLF